MEQINDICKSWKCPNHEMLLLTFLLSSDLFNHYILYHAQCRYLQVNRFISFTKDNNSGTRATHNSLHCEWSQKKNIKTRLWSSLLSCIHYVHTIGEFPVEEFGKVWDPLENVHND